MKMTRIARATAVVASSSDDWSPLASMARSMARSEDNKPEGLHFSNRGEAPLSTAS
jgi:hypothetical protein